MTATLESVLIGSAISLTAGFALFLNLFVGFFIYFGGFLKKDQNGFYILTFATVIGNSLNMAIFAFYLGPISIIQDFIFPGGAESFAEKFISFLTVGQWYEEMFIQIIVAIDRFVNIILPKYSFVLSRKVKIYLVVGVFIASFIMVSFSELVLPCCYVYVYYGDYSYAMLGNITFNYRDAYVDLPLNTASSAIAMICYVTIFLYIVRSNRQIKTHLRQSEMEKRRAKEVGYAIQFGVISIFVLFCWVFVRIFPLLIPTNYLSVYSIIAFCLIFHQASQPIIYITMNKEFKEKIRQKLFSANSSSVQVVQSYPNRQKAAEN